MIFCGAAANGGKAAVPQIIDHTAFHEGVRTSLYIKHSTDQLLNESTADTLKSMMKAMWKIITEVEISGTRYRRQIRNSGKSTNQSF